MSDSLGDRMKRYEGVFHSHLVPKIPIVIRVDGRSFHTWTRKAKAKEPFDPDLQRRFVETAKIVSGKLQGFAIGYHQSDEVSFVLYDDMIPTSEQHFGGDIQKIVSTTASLFTRAFNAFFDELPAEFDCRVFSLPEQEVANYLLWRIRDWERNSLSMLCGSHFPHKQLDGKGKAERHEMLHGIGVNWADLEPRWKNGTLFANKFEVTDMEFNYERLNDLVYTARQDLDRISGAC